MSRCFQDQQDLGTLYIAGKGAHFDGDITSHTKHVLDNSKKNW